MYKSTKSGSFVSDVRLRLQDYSLFKFKPRSSIPSSFVKWTHQRWLSALGHLLALFEEALWRSLRHNCVNVHWLVLLDRWAALDNSSWIISSRRCVPTLWELLSLRALILVPWEGQVGPTRLHRTTWTHNASIILIRHVLCRSINASSLIESGSVRRSIHRRIATLSNGTVHLFDLKFTRESLFQLLSDTAHWLHGVAQNDVSLPHRTQALPHVAVSDVRFLNDSRVGLWQVMTNSNHSNLLA